MGKKILWTEAERALLKELYEAGAPWSEMLARFPERTRGALEACVYYRGIKRKTIAGGWTPEQIAQVGRLCTKEGLSAQEIADRFPGRTRNAVIGVIHRNGFYRARTERKPKPLTRAPGLRAVAPSPSSPPRPVRKNPKAQKPRPAAPPLRAVDTPTYDVLELGKDMCRFPVTADKPHRFCGAPTDGGPYCAHHAQIVVSEARMRSAAEEEEDAA